MWRTVPIREIMLGEQENRQASRRNSWRGVSLICRVTILLALGAALFLAGRASIGAAYAQEGTAAALRRAIRWDSSDPEYYSRLSHLLATALDVPETNELVALDSEAVRLGPNRVAQWLELASDAEWEGDERRAREAYEQAIELEPNSPQVNWAAGNFDLRQGESAGALRRLRATIAGDSELREAAFEAAWRATNDGNMILRESLPCQHDALFDYLDYLSKTRRLDDAGQVWKEILQSRISFAPADAFGYLDALLVSKRVDELSASWNAMLAAHLDGMPQPSRQGNLITNGDFETDLLGGGLDWHVQPVEGTEVSRNDVDCFDRGNCLEIQFDGQHNLDYRGVWQFVPVQPDTSYRFSAYVRTEGITTGRGIRFWILDYYDQHASPVLTASVTGTTDWTPETADIHTGPETRMLELIVHREPSAKFDSKIGGRSWIAHVSLVALK